MADTISIDIGILQGIFTDLTRLQTQLNGVAGVAGTLDAAMGNASGGIRQSLSSVTGAVQSVENATDNAMRNMVGDIMGPLAKSRELEQKLQDLGDKVRTSRSVGEIMKLKKEITATQRELDKVNTGGMERKVSGGVGRMSGMLRGLAGPIAGAFAIGSVTTFIGGMVKAAGAQQVFKSSLNNILGSKQAADKIFEDAQKFANTTPFDLAQVQVATQQLSAYQFANEEIIPTMRMVGNVASAVGADFGQVAKAYGTAKTQGTVYTKDLMQFTNVGIPIMGELAKVLGVNTDQVNELASKGQIGFAQLEEAMNLLGGPTGKWSRQLEDASDTITGRLSNLSGDFHSFVANLGLSLAPVIEKAISGLNSALDGVKKTVAWIKENGPLVKGVLTGIAVAVGIYTTVLLVNNAGLIVSNALQSIAAIRMGVVAAVTNVVTAATTLWTGAQWLLNAALTANPIGIVVVAIAALVAGVVYAWNNFEGFRAFLFGLWAAVKSVFFGIKDIVTTVFGSLVDIVAGFGKTLIGAITLDPAMVKEGILQGAKGIRDAMSVTDKIKDLGMNAGLAYAEGDAEGRASFAADQPKAAEPAGGTAGTTNAKAVTPGDNVGADALLGGTAPGGTAAGAGGAGSTVAGNGGGGDKNIAMNITMNMQFGIGRDVQQSARDTAEQVVAMITNKLRDAQFALG